jgi:hypothetical protein
MKTAQGAISVDVSKFNSAIDSAKGKLSSFGSSLSTIGNSAKLAWKAFDAVANVSEKISTIAKGAKDLQSILNALPTVVKRVSDGFQNLKTFASQVGEVLSKVPTTFKVIGASAVVAGVSIFGVVKALQAVSGATKSALSGISSVASGLSNMAKSATTAVGGAVSSAFRGFLNILKPVGVAVGGLGLAFGALDRFFKIGILSAIEMGDEMKNLSARTGASIPFLFDLQKLLKNSGVNGLTGASAIQNMQRALTGINADGEPTNDMIKRLNLNLDDLNKMNVDKQLLSVLTTISKLGSEAEQTAALFSIFGRAGAGMKAILKDPSFLQLGTKQSQLGVSLAKNADNFSKISSKLRDSGSFFRGFFVEMAGAVAPSILELFKLFEGGDMLAGFGAKLGQQIRFGIEVLTGAFKSGMLLDLLKATFETSVIVFKDLFERTAKFVSAYLNKLLSTDALEGLSSGLIDVFTGFAKVVGAMLLRAFETPIAYFQTGIEFAVLYATKAFDSLFKNFATIGKGFARGGAIGGAIASVSVLTSDKSLPDQKEFGNLLKEKLENGVQFGLGEFQINSRSANEGINQIALGAKEAFNGVKTGVDALIGANIKFGEQSKEVTDQLAKYKGMLSAIAVAGKASAEGAGDVVGAEVLGAKLKKGSPEAGISSLQKIGGGGGAFRAADPMVKESQKQTAVMEKVATLIEPITKKVTEYSLVPSMNQGGMVRAFLN